MFGCDRVSKTQQQMLRSYLRFSIALAIRHKSKVHFGNQELTKETKCRQGDQGSHPDEVLLHLKEFEGTSEHLRS
ncbi:hypothetical protein JRQ81_009432 [Phrynocephalus forsythii]|uniref:Uncharacterized protein n=1 Tax=Phrynocephalus forsythii TaxID=171643 RepID=A0A9Q1AS91_9SAUR|nr:hypothetical protein JRQ81_009432 [Phrynocephalus forsythii]